MEFTEILSDRNVIMQYEIVHMLLLLLVPAVKINSEKWLAAVWGVVFLFFIYIHRTLLPFIVSGVWFFVTAGIVSVFLDLKLKSFLKPAEFFLSRGKSMLKRPARPFFVVIILILLIQLCRINVAIDYDSLRYGLRSDVLLSDDGIAGFFKNIGLVNTVYTYPKGYEVLTLPLKLLSDLTYGYVLCFNVWILIAVLIIIGEITAILIGERYNEKAAIASAAAALVPGITNMSITAKSDLITLLCQLIFIYAVVRYLNTKEKYLTGLGIGALILSLAFKPTALVFSGVIGLCALCFVIIRRVKMSIDFKGARAIAVGGAYAGVMTLRTFLITGLPITSIFTGVMSAVGFKLKYPFGEQTAISSESAEISLERIETYISRVLHFFFSPTGDDMEHVLMAWGGLVFFIMAAAAVILFRKTIKNAPFCMGLKSIRDINSDTSNEKDRGDVSKNTGVLNIEFLYAVFFTVAVFSFISLWFLYQVDGNYFMLWYSISVIAGCTAFIIYIENKQINEERDRIKPDNETDMPKRGHGYYGAVLVSVVMVYFTAFTSWNGSCGFTPIDLLNKGYYNHEVEYGLMDPIGYDKHTRVVAFAYEPDCYKLKGRVESWVDIDGSGGNTYLTDTKLDVFKEYLSFADIDYIYAEIDFLTDESNDRNERVLELFKYLLEDGCFEMVTLAPYSSNMLFCRIDKERMAESWEEDMGTERRTRTLSQQEYLMEISGGALY